MSESPTAAVLLIGNELLSGRTADANMNHIARRMTDIGVALRECRVVRDEEMEIIEALNALRNRYTYVFTTGGIGPTHDDITVQTVAKAFNVAVQRHQPTVEKMKEYYGDRATDATFKMADFPEGSTLIENPESVAPGFRLGNVFCMAGIPRIMQVMLEAAIPQLQRGDTIHSKALDVMAPESKISAPLEEIQSRYPALDIGSYPFRVDNQHGTSLVVRGTDASQVERAYQAIAGMVDELGAAVRG